MPRGHGLVTAVVLCAAASAAFAGDPAAFPEYGIVHSGSSHAGSTAYTYWQSKDLTGALGLWEASRRTGDKPCGAAPFCTLTQSDGPRTVVLDDNYVVSFAGAPKQAQMNAVLATLPGKRETSLPAILTFIPQTGLVPGSARYILGPASFQAFAPELDSVQPGFEEGAEGQVAEYGHAKLALFYYPTPEMARLHSIGFKSLGTVFVKRSGVLVVIVYGSVSQQQADTLLSRVEYEAKITWNENVPQSPIKPLYQLLVNILILSGIIVALCVAAGLMYGGTRIYRRRYGQLEADEAMTTLRLTGHP